MHWYFLQEMHFLVTVHEMPCIVIPRLLILLLILCTELLRLIQLEPLNLETLFKLCCVGLVKDTYAMYFSFLLPLFFPSSTLLSFFFPSSTSFLLSLFFPFFTLLSFLLSFLPLFFP